MKLDNKTLAFQVWRNIRETTDNIISLQVANHIEFKTYDTIVDFTYYDLYDFSVEFDVQY